MAEFSSKLPPSNLALPAENTLDRMTATLPALLRRRLDQFGIDFALLYPTRGLPVLHLRDDEVHPACARALNRYYTEVFSGHRDRVEPVAVIPSFTPEEAIADLDHAVGELGLKAIVTSAVIVRGGRGEPEWIDTLGHGSAYDYDPVWRRCAELGVAPAFHALGYLWGTCASSTNYVYNHLGHFAAAQEAACRSLLMGGVPKRFPSLRFSFLEGGVAWGCQLFADALGLFDKRNKDAVQTYDPARLDHELSRALFERFADGPLANHRAAFDPASFAPPLRTASIPDDFADSGLRTPEDILEIFTRQFHVGCEADDPMNALAFNSTMLPYSARLNAMFASDIGHWDVRDMTRVLPDAWALVEDGHLDPDDFRDFVFGNVVRMVTAVNPSFFAGTSVQRDAERLVGSSAA